MFFENKKILITGGAGFIGSTLINKLLDFENNTIINLDKLGYASDLTPIKLKLKDINTNKSNSYKFLNIDLSNFNNTEEAIKNSKPDIIFHLAAESHVDRSIDSPYSFIESNILGTYNLLEATLKYWNSLPEEKRNNFRLVHISTDEVFGTLEGNKRFHEKSPYLPNSPYSATKASSDMLVRAWNKTYNLPTIITNCSNNFGPWQFPEKLIPNTVLKALSRKNIPVYGEGENIRDWIFVDDHIEALLIVSEKAQPGSNYCIGGECEIKNIDIVFNICKLVQEILDNDFDYSELISFVTDRPGHDLRYSIDNFKVKSDFNWTPKGEFDENLKKTVIWYIENLKWCNEITEQHKFKGQRIGLYKS